MKRLILSLAIAGCFALSTAKAQTVNDVKLSDIKEEYIEVSAVGNNGVFIYLDYGQKSNLSKLIVKDENGKNLEYNSVIDFINKMKPHGYELFQVYKQNDRLDAKPRYILKRKSI